MKVKTLIAALLRCHPDAEVYIEPDANAQDYTLEMVEYESVQAKANNPQATGVVYLINSNKGFVDFNGNEIPEDTRFVVT